MLLLIPLLPFLGFLVNASFGRRLSKAASGALACGAMAGSFAVSLVAVWRLVGMPEERKENRGISYFVWENDAPRRIRFVPRAGTEVRK